MFCAAILLAGLFSACGAAGETQWEGEWNRTGTGTDSAEITIANVTEESFDFTFLSLHMTSIGGANTGELEGTARITAENRAVFEYEDGYSGEKIRFEFAMDDGKLFVSASENVLGLFGWNVTIDGVYEKWKDAEAAAPAQKLPDTWLSAAEAKAVYDAWLERRAELSEYTLAESSETYEYDGEEYYLFRAEEMSRYWYNILVHMETGALLFMMTPDGEDPETTIESLDDWYDEHYAP